MNTPETEHKPLNAGDRSDLKDRLSSAASMTFKQFNVHILVLFVVLSVNRVTKVDWASTYQERERAAVTVLSRLYPEGDKGSEKPAPSIKKLPTASSGGGASKSDSAESEKTKSYKTLAYLRKMELMAAVDHEKIGTPEWKVASGHLDQWKLGIEHLEYYFNSRYDFNNPGERSVVKQILEEDLKENSDEIVQEKHFQLPFLGQSYDSDDRSYVLGAALCLSGGALLLALWREFRVVNTLFARLTPEHDSEFIESLSWVQYLYTPGLRPRGVWTPPEWVTIAIPYLVIWLPVSLQALMVYQLENIPWLKHEETRTVMWTQREGILFGLILFVIAVFSSAVVSSLRRIWTSFNRLRETA